MSLTKNSLLYTTIHFVVNSVQVWTEQHNNCSFSKCFDRFEYLFNFDNTFEIHDDIEVLKRMGMAFGLEKGECAEANLKASRTMVPKALEPYVVGKQEKISFGGLPLSKVSCGK